MGPVIWVGVPPNIAASNPTMIAPYKPAVAPRPLATPSAIASGRAITPAVIPPKISPLGLEKIFVFIVKIPLL